MTPRLAALCLLTATVATAAPTTMTFSLDQPFTLAFGDTATGPDGLSIWFSGSGPSFTLKKAGKELSPTWAKAPDAAKSGPRLRGHFGDLFLTVEDAPDEDHVRLRVTRAKPVKLAWGAPLTLGWCEFAVDPDGAVWSVARFDDSAKANAWVQLNIEGQQGFSFSTSQGSVEQRSGDFLVTLEHALPTSSATSVRLSVRKPGAEVRPLTLGKPFSLIPEESASGEGLKLRLEGYGHKISEAGDLAFIELKLWAGGEEGWLRFFREPSPAPQRWHGYEVRMTACEDEGPPHSSTAKTTFVVVKAR